MADIFYNAPCELYQGFLDDDETFRSVLERITDFQVYDRCRLKKYKLETEDIREIGLKELGITLNDPIYTWKQGKKLYAKYIENTRNAPAFFSISHATYWHFREEDTTEWERAVLLAYLAIKSMVGKREMIKTNMLLICLRMEGHTKSRGHSLSPATEKFTNRYWKDRLMRSLFERYGVTFYGGTKAHKVRGFYCSTQLTMEQLIIKAETLMATERNKPKDPLMEAKRLAIEKINNGVHL